MNSSDSIRTRVTVIGGGTGTTAVLSGLKKFSHLDIRVVVSMTDDGGSNQVVRDQFGLLPLSDLRKSIIALAGTGNDLLRSMFTYRFDKGDGLVGHTLGNLMMMGLSEITGSEVAAVEAMSRLFQVEGMVIPVTLDKTNLVATYSDGTSVCGEHVIDEPVVESKRKITKLTLTPVARAYDKAVAAVQDADYIIAGPGDLYTTTLANIIVPGISEAIQKNTGTFIFVCNLMTKKGQTHDMPASELVREVERYAGRVPDVVIVHNQPFPPDIIEKYREEGESVIVDDIGADVSYRVIRRDVVFDHEIVKDAGDTLKRSLVRHDADKLANVLHDIFQHSVQSGYST